MRIGLDHHVPGVRLQDVGGVLVDEADGRSLQRRHRMQVGHDENLHRPNQCLPRLGNSMEQELSRKIGRKNHVQLGNLDAVVDVHIGADSGLTHELQRRQLVPDSNNQRP